MHIMTSSSLLCQKWPAAVTGHGWWTQTPEEDEDPEDAVRFDFGHRYEVTGRSLLLFVLRPARATRRKDTGAQERRCS